MGIIEMFLTKTITQIILKKSAEDASIENDKKRVEQVDFLKKLFTFFAVVGFIVSGIVFFIAQEKIAGIILLVLFEGLFIPILIYCKNCWIDYDDLGFTISNFFGVKSRYSYEDVIGLNNNGSSVEIELINKKRIRLDQMWLNKRDFAYTICDRRSKKPKKLEESVLGMSLDEIIQSYQNGKLKKALMVSEKDDVRKKFVKFKVIHYIICTISITISILYIFIYDLEILFNYIFLNNGLMLLAVILYYKYLEYFTAREKAEINTSKINISKYHKRCTQAIISMSTVINNIIFALSATSISTKPENNFVLIIISIIISIALFLLMIIIFKKYSWEYREYRVGYVSYFVWHLFYCFGFAFMIYGLMRIL